MQAFPPPSRGQQVFTHSPATRFLLLFRCKKREITALHGRGLPSLINSAGRLLTHENYAKRVNTYAKNQITASASSPEGAGPPSGQELYDKLENLFFIEHEIKHLFEVPPNYYKYTEADEILMKIQRHQLPTEEWWSSMIGTLL